MTPEWLQELLKMWGPGALILFGLYLLLRRAVPRDFFGRFVSATEQQATAFTELSTAVRDAGAVHQRALDEIRHGQDVMLDRMEQLKERIHAQ